MSNEEAGKEQQLQVGDSSTGRGMGQTGVSLSKHHSQSPSGSDTSGEDSNPRSTTELSMPAGDLLDFSRNLLSQDPSSQLFVPIAEEFCARKLWKEAVETCRRGLVYHPRQFRGRVLLGWALWQLGEVEEAERLLREARTELEKNAVIYKILADLAEKKGDSDQAWRLMHIYQSLQDGNLHRKMEQRNEITQTSIPQTQQTKESSFIDVLLSLLMKYEQKQPIVVPKPHLFSEADREVLKNIINAGTS
ncbi:MAG: hypothetical protein WCA08_13950 [Desulfoferrobacter sp.]